MKNKIYAYLRASTKEQNSERAKKAVDDFLLARNKNADEYFIENKSGTTLDRPKLAELIEVAQRDDILVVEQIDRLTRLRSDDWRKLKNSIEGKGVFIVSIDVPTSHVFLEPNSITTDFYKLMNNLIIDILATTARKDYEDMLRRQREGIARAKAEGKYKGKKQSPETITKCEKAIKLIEEKQLTNAQAALLSDVGQATFYRYLKDNDIVIRHNKVYRGL